ncbi:MAG: NAD-binding protein [Elusimicrobia bacterium]|nr:NAD-binding protein [Elusimicrobiota bacterium]
MSFRNRLAAAFLAMAVVVLIGVAGYHLIEGWALFDALYMTVITLATVGYGETHPLSSSGRMFTIFLIMGGIGILTYAFSVITAFLVEGELKEVLLKKRMEKKIAALSQHYIVCGGGRTGRYIIDELRKTGRDFVVVDQDDARVTELGEDGCLAIAGDASDDETLRRAGIEKAKGLVACLPSDKDNVFVVISAKGLNPGLRVVSKSVDKGVRDKLLRSGADAVVSPNFIGGLRMASELVRPAVVSFLDNMLRGDGNLRIEEVVVGPSAAGKTLESSVLKNGFDLALLAVRPAGKEQYIYNPKPQTPLSPKDVLVVMGPAEEVQKLQQSL